METSPSTYSPFPALAAVLAAFIVLFGFDFYASLRQRAVLGAQLEAAEKVLPEAQKVNATLQALTKDVLQLAPTSPGAAQIVRDLKIQVVGAGAKTAGQP